MFAECGLPAAGGDRVRVATVQQQDIAPYRRAVGQSRHRLARWNPVDPDDLDRHLPLQSRDYRAFLIHARAPEGEHDIVGRINIVNALRGRFESAATGYDAYDPYAGRGLFAEGLRLVVGLAFTPEATGGMGLRRVAATVQPGNVRSAGLLRSLGFRREGFSPRMLWLPDATGNDAWRGHDSYVMLRDEWPSQPYRPARRRKVVALVNGAADSGATALARTWPWSWASRCSSGTASGTAVQAPGRRCLRTHRPAGWCWADSGRRMPAWWPMGFDGPG